MRVKYLSWIFVLLLLVVCVYAIPITDSINLTQNVSVGQTQDLGIGMTALKNISILYVNKVSAGNPTNALLYNSYGELLCNASFSGNVANFTSCGVSFLSNYSFYVMIGKNNALYNAYYNPVSIGNVTINGSNVRFDDSCASTLSPNCPSNFSYVGEYVYNFANITTEETSILNNSRLNISVFKESDGSKLYGNVSVSFVGDSGFVFYDSFNQSKLYPKIFFDNYSIGFSQSGYALRSYRVYLSLYNLTTLNVYLNNGSSVLFNFKTSTGTALPGVLFNVYTVINGSTVLVESTISDITGKVQVALEGSKYYAFSSSLSDYNNYSFILNPVLFSSYDVVLTPTSSGNLVVPSAQVIFTPSSFRRFQNVNFNIQFISQYNNLASYMYNVSYPNNSFGSSGSNSHGQSFNSSFNLNSANINSNVTIFYEYTLTNGVYYNRTLVYPIVYVYSNRTWSNMGNNINSTTGQDSVTGYFVGERIIIVTLFAIIMFGVGWSIGGALPGLIFAMIPIMFFINAGFVPKQLYYVTFFFMAIYFISRGSDT